MKYTRAAADCGCLARLRSIRLFLSCNCTLNQLQCSNGTGLLLRRQAGGLPEAVEASLGNPGKESSAQKLLPRGHCCSNNRPSSCASLTAATVWQFLLKSARLYFRLVKGIVGSIHFFLVLEGRVLLCSPCWPWTQDSSMSVSWVLGHW